MKLKEIQDLLKSNDEEVRRSVLQLLKGAPLVESLGIIFIAMGDESWRVRKESVEAFVNAAPDEIAIEKLLELLRSEDNAGLRNSAAEAVIRLGTAATLPLIRMVKDPDADVRKFIVDLMGVLRDPSFVEHLLNALSDTDENVAAAAAEHLGSSGDSSVVPDLIRAIISNQAVLFRFSALRALSALAKPSYVPDEILSLAEQDILCKAVYDCLGSISDDCSVSLLINGFDSRQKSCRSSALKAVYKIYERSGIDARQKIIGALRSMNGKEVISGLLNLFDRRDALLTEALIWCSAATADTRFVPVLVESFEDERFTESALKTLKSFGAEGLAIVVAHYPAASENARRSICELIGECGYSGYSDLVACALKDNSSTVRMAATNAVAKLGMVLSIPDLVALTDDNDPNVSSAAVSSLQVLALIDSSDILNIAGHFSDSESPRHRRYASLLYASLGEYDRLLLLTKDESSIVRQSAINEIGRLRLKSSGSILVMALVDEDPDVRMAAAEALGNINESCALDALERTLADEDVWVRCAVLKAISKIDRERTLTIIKRVHASADGLFMITCLQLLEEDGGQEAQAIISSYLANPDPDIARQASQSLEHCYSDKQYSGCS